MVEIKYKSASGPEEIINKRMQNSGGEEADKIIKSGEGVRRVFHNIHLSGSAKQRDPDNKGEGSIDNRPRGSNNTTGEI
jgi:hypothetical protein